MRIRDLFAGRSVTLCPHEDGWLVAITGPNGQEQVPRIYAGLPEALDAAHEWLLLMADDTELHSGMQAAAEQVAGMMREYLARRAAGEPVQEPTGLESLIDHDRLREWFEREMGSI